MCKWLNRILTQGIFLMRNNETITEDIIQEKIPYFPMMMDIREKRFLIIGGGNIACEKLSRLRGWTSMITVVALTSSQAMDEMIHDGGFSFYQRSFVVEDLDNVDIVIVAADDIALQRFVYEEATRRKILCNAVDLAEYSHFIFPSVIQRGDLVVAISTSGASPAMAKHLKRFLEKIFSDDIGHFLEQMRNMRAALPKGKERMALLDAHARDYIEQMLTFLKKKLL